MDFWQGQTQAQAWIWWGGKAGQTCVLPLSHQVLLGSSDLGPVLPPHPCWPWRLPTSSSYRGWLQ